MEPTANGPPDRLSTPGVSMQQLSVRTRVEQCLARVSELNEILGALITVVPEIALEEADRCDQAIRDGKPTGSLHGMTFTVKDNIETKGVVTTQGSEFFRNFVPDRDAEVVRRVKEAGAILIGKANLHEFAFGATSQNPHYGPCKNPWDIQRIPGGSSGGSGVAVATEMCDFSLGTDTGGSVRIPASLNGVSGFRPTYGRVPNTGVSATSSGFCVVGPLARRAKDIARVFEELDGYHPEDPCSVASRAVSEAPIDQRMDGIRIGVPERFFFEPVCPSIENRVKEALGVFEQLGAIVETIDIPDIDAAQKQMTRMIYPDAASNHRKRIESEPNRFGEDVLRRLMLGYHARAIDYAEAVNWRRNWTREVDRLFTKYDALITPTVPIAAPRIEDTEMLATTAHLTQLTCAWSMASVPCISVPCGTDEMSLPVGMQMASRAHHDRLVLGMAVAYQTATTWHEAEPPIIARG